MNQETHQNDKLPVNNMVHDTTTYEAYDSLKHLIIGKLNISGINIPKITTEYQWKDRLGSYQVRWGLKRMKYRVLPGLYAVGEPDENSNIFVTANYKMSFDELRCNLKNIDAWILVLDTQGVNVWCAAGKGTFGTDELVNQINLNKLSEIVKHRKLIVPQLGAVGVSAHKVKKITGFAVHFGPVRASDIQEYLKLNRKATPAMRKVNFTFFDRLILTPIEFATNLKYLIYTFVAYFLVSFIFYLMDSSATLLVFSLIPFIIVAYFLGTVIAPLLLPYIPFKSFSSKGALMGVIGFMLLRLESSSFILHSTTGWLMNIIWLLLMISITSFLTMNFTGSTTFTSLSGVQKEMKLAMPIQISFTVLAFLLFIITGIIWGGVNG